MRTIHAYTVISACSSGAAKAVGKVIPELDGKLTVASLQWGGA